MSIVQFWRIVWAWRWFIAATTVSCVIGAILVMILLPPRWEADARVVLNVLKPDPITGEVISGSATNSYVSSQISLVTDYSVASRVVDAIGWSSDPVLIAQYNARSASDTRDFRHWAAELIIKNTKVTVPLGSNILDITYTGSTAEGAKVVAETLRTAYIDSTLAMRRDRARTSADQLDDEVRKAKAALEAAETTKYNFEREHNVIMANSTTDLDTARLTALATTNGAADAGENSISVQLAEVSSAITQLTKTLGPNHPELIALQAKRAALSAAMASGNGSSSARRSGSALDSQAARVLAKSADLVQVKQLQSQIDVRRDIYNGMLAAVAKLRLEETAADTAMFSLLGPATVPEAPTFPKPYLIIPGSFALGLLLGMLLSILVELLKRRVRGPEDLKSALDVPLLAVISCPK